MMRQIDSRDDYSQQGIRCSADFLNIPGGISSRAYVNGLKSRPWGRHSPRKSLDVYNHRSSQWTVTARRRLKR